MSFNYEEAKAQYGVGRAREMEKEAAAGVPAAPSGPIPTPPMPAGPIAAPKGGVPAPAPMGGSPNFQSDFARQFDSSGRDVNLGNADPNAVLAGTGASGYNAGDVGAYRNIDPAILAGMTPEQRAVWSMQNIDDLSAHGDKERSYSQWMEWQKSYDSNCPPGTPYQAEDGSGCVEKPDNSNRGAAGPGGPGGGGAGGAGGGGGDAGGAGAGGDLSSMMEANLKGMLSGKSSRYNPEAMQGLLAQIKQRIESSKGNQIRQATSEAAGRGMSRSGRTGTNLSAIRRGAESDFTSEYGNVLRAKIDADRIDKLDALDRSQKYLDSLRDELYRRDMSAIQRQQFKANLDLAYANLAAQRSNMMAGFQQQKDMLGAQYGYQATFGSM